MCFAVFLASLGGLYFLVAEPAFIADPEDVPGFLLYVNQLLFLHVLLHSPRGTMAYTVFTFKYIYIFGDLLLIWLEV